MNFSEKRILGKTGLQVGRLGLASSYKAPVKAFEEAFERGCNYFVWNSFIRGRSPRMRDAIRNIINKGQRDKLVIAMHSYGHNAFINRHYFMKSLKVLGTDYIDIMLLGYQPNKPARSVMGGALKMKKEGHTRFIGLTGHNRKVFPMLDAEGELDVFHIRYNAVNSGAETDVFPHLRKEGREGIVAFTATRWGQLLNPKKMPEGETPPTAADCYRFVLTNPNVDVCLTGPKTLEQMRENLSVLDQGPMNSEEIVRIRRIGDHIYGKKRITKD
jgi:aryl-alcohol dehydrogenase-like predicted oxidoreductase